MPFRPQVDLSDSPPSSASPATMSFSFHLADNQLWHTPRQTDALSTQSLYSVSPPSSPVIEDLCDLYLTFDHYPSSDTSSIDEPITHSAHSNRDGDIVILQDRDGILFPAQLFDGNLIPSHDQREASPPLSSISFPPSEDFQWNFIRDSSEDLSSATVEWSTILPPSEAETDHILSLLHHLHLPDTQHYDEMSSPTSHYSALSSSNDGSDEEYIPSPCIQPRALRSLRRPLRLPNVAAQARVRAMRRRLSLPSSSPNPKSFKCPFCRYVQTNRRRPDLNRHILTHLTNVDPEKWICCGVPLEEAHEHGIVDLDGVPMSDYAGLIMVEGARRRSAVGMRLSARKLLIYPSLSTHISSTIPTIYEAWSR
ncbi:hypothetical protein A0H81_06809 [Grifola frondosa]|uniref:Uncharacterized protein n=1 Tax=Grifola frondosa TaxID=5627 RepID=A0A1C7M7V2_GRIFR|nr:hypothetical protein A0H81_06809 [Grifola frondosa]